MTVSTVSTVSTDTGQYSARNDKSSATISSRPDRETREIALSEIEADREQPRELFDEEELEALARSMASDGLFNPITVRYVEDSTFSHYVVIAGERRLRSATKLGWESILCTVLHCDSDQAFGISLKENLIRQDLNPIEVGRGIRRWLSRNPAMTEIMIGSEIGKSQSWVNSKLRLLGLPDAVVHALQSGGLSESHGKALAALNGHPKEVLALYSRTLSEHLSSKQLERAVADVKERIEARETGAEGQSALPLGLDDEEEPMAAAESDDERFTSDAAAAEVPAPNAGLTPATPEEAAEFNRLVAAAFPAVDDDSDSDDPDDVGVVVYTETPAAAAVTAAEPLVTVESTTIEPRASSLPSASGSSPSQRSVTPPPPAAVATGFTLTLTPRYTAILTAINDSKNTRMTDTYPDYATMTLSERVEMMIEVYASQCGIDTEAFGE